MAIFFQVSPNLEQVTTSILLYKIVDYNPIYNKLDLRENKKRKIKDASTSRVEPPHHEMDDDDFWANHDGENDQWEEALALPHEEKTQPPSTTIEEHLDYFG